MRVLSLGAGVQSTTLLLASRDGLLTRLDAAIFADTGWEPAAVYRHLTWLVGEIGTGPEAIPIYRVSQGDIRHDTLRSAENPGERNDTPLFAQRLLVRDGELQGDEIVRLPLARASKRIASMPFHVRNTEGGHGLLRRQCTSEYKIEPIHALLRHLTGRKPRQRKGELVEEWLGISRDEWQRVSTSRTPWITLVYPLISTLRWSRADCLSWLAQRGYPTPPKSSCLGCPYHNDQYWRALKDSGSSEWADVVAFDAAVRATPIKGITGDVYLHRSLVPLVEADLRTGVERAQAHGQLTLDFDLAESGGVCDSGYCTEGLS
jgi:hypothetical protein